MTETHITRRTTSDGRNRTAESRTRPFALVLLVGLLGVPLFVAVLRLMVFFDQGLTWLIIWLDLALFGLVGPLVALGIGHRVRRGLPFVIWHVAVTVHLFAVATSVSVWIGWRPLTEPWYLRLVDVVKMPGWWYPVHVFVTLAVAGSWLLYRIDAFRSAAGAGGDGRDDTWGELLKMPAGARVRGGSVRVDDTAVEATIDHRGVPIADLRGKLPALEETPGVVRGRSSLVPTKTGGVSTVRFVHTDPYTKWRPFPGLSHPGGSYAHPLRTSYYSNGKPMWYSLARTPDGFRSQVCPDFRSPNDVFIGRQGMTGSGKSGDTAVELAEIFSRTDVLVVYVDLAKLLQNAGWCLDFCSLAAGNAKQSRRLFAALRRLGEHRSEVLGRAGFRSMSPAAYRATGLAYVHIFADEFDVVANSRDVEWCATKGRSLGIFLSLTLPRATADKMSGEVRGAIGQWKQFGISQDYDKGFVIAKETIAAGANPEGFGATVPGLHYLDMAPGVDPSLYPIDGRTYETRQDFGDLRRAVEAARATFTPATFTPGEIEVLGDVYRECRPSVVRAGRKGLDDEPPAGDLIIPAGTPTPARDYLAAQQQEGQPMTPTDTDTDGTPDTGDADLDELLAESRAAADTADLTAEFGPILRDTVLPGPDTGGVDLEPVKPRARHREQAIDEFEEALKRMAARGVSEFGNKDVAEEMTVDMSPGWISERFTALCDEDHAYVAPPGLTIERVGRGRYMLTRVDTAALAGAHGE